MTPRDDHPSHCDAVTHPFLSQLQSVDGLDVEMAMRMSMRDIGFLEKLVRLFLNTHRQEPEALRRLMADGNFAEIRKVVHGLKSAAGMIGATKVSRLAESTQEMMHRSHEIPVPQVTRLADETEAMLSALERVMETVDEA